MSMREGPNLTSVKVGGTRTRSSHRKLRRQGTGAADSSAEREGRLKLVTDVSRIYPYE